MIDVVVQEQWHLDCVDIYVVERVELPGPVKSVLKPGGREGWREIREREVEEPVDPPLPTLRLPHMALRALVDALDEVGVRTEHDATLRGTIDAMRLHLDDMRRLVGVVPMPQTQVDRNPLTREDLEESYRRLHPDQEVE
jgi:hypothetical protein